MPRVNTTDEVFKKAEQTVGKPETTKRDINEEYLRNAPQNTDHSVNQHKQTYRRRMSVVGAKEGMNEGETGSARLGEGSLGELEEAEPHEGLGRQKMEGELAEIAREDAVHP
ncbi:hypothetical protein M413DRAFT_10808 [Hebeloma cylindrosporum]|uniref:Uncharacterized protein n=1 Tax=Hebeloma cylindrosporum TaxID=76867 RepID=A0A0C3CEC2_HEBCY|nr:hypothetical protein M413DRAFT_10808 [Hebeloma cylindrosporum h7]